MQSDPTPDDPAEFGLNTLFHDDSLRADAGEGLLAIVQILAGQDGQLSELERRGLMRASRVLCTHLELPFSELYGCAVEVDPD